MTISGIHLLLTYKCSFACDHCFVYACPDAKGVMRISDVREILSEAQKAGNLEMMFFEGGEPFLYYQTMLWGLRAAKERGFKRGIVTNAYWATSVEDAKEWLGPVSEVGVSALSISDDAYQQLVEGPDHLVINRVLGGSKVFIVLDEEMERQLRENL